ncbi:hypothetical protein CAPTEDRAFT_154247 [Capitella teleta]|uniref:Actin-modulator n=1 Tax=Capitella teleta TaxID=283909 RepID=R7U815_CAPTE|nr:hypothetical protein CAPTEDRAFT_154247 [Capitella teleta]|eukprot:ELU02124.1 hypothetical protein CAPTEDRAFT_154247 [Capitella teleta]
MSGLVKAKKYDWKDSNMALFGSDTEKQVKKESAEGEPAWEGAGQEAGMKIWRIVKFEVTEWPTEDYGKFFSGDSYIILNTYKPNEDSEELAYDVHFWIGKHSTQDEYGTAAYKTVELDTFLDDKPVQHREVQGHESALFRSYFRSGIVIMAGGAETGFRHVAPEEYTPRLLHFCGNRKAVTVTEVPLSEGRLNSNDVFILDMGTQLYQWNGSGANKDEKFKAMQFLSQLKSERSAQSETLDEDDTSKSHDFYSHLTEEDEDDEDIPDEAGIKNVFRVSDESGEIAFSEFDSPVSSAADLDSGDVFVVDTGCNCFVWIGGGASPAEKKNGFSYAHKHLQSTNHQLVPIVVVKEGQQNTAFETAIAA